MAITLNGTTGITTPADTITGNATVGGTLTVAGATTVGGVAVVAVAPSTAGNVLTSNGSAWASTAPATPASGQIQTVIFSSSSTWTCPTGVTKAQVVCVGGGSGSAINAYGTCPNPATGGCGGVAVALVTVVPGTIYTITVGPGSAGVGTTTLTTISSSAGGTTSFGSLVTATGGGGATATSGGGTNGTAGTGSTTGTLLRNSSQFYPGASIFFNGGGTDSGSSVAVVWSVSSIYLCGGGPAATVAYIGRGGIGGAVAIQYVG